MSEPQSVALEQIGSPFVVRNTFIEVIDEVLEVPKFVKNHTHSGAYQDRSITSNLPELAPLNCAEEANAQLAERFIMQNNADARSCGYMVTHSHDASDVASSVSTKDPSEISPIGVFCGQVGSDSNSFSPQSCGAYLLQQDCRGMAWGDEQDFMTTLVLRNIPESFTRCKLEELLNTNGFATCFDFLYLPADLKTGFCFGYAFINMVTPSDAKSFMERFTNFQDWPMPSDRRAVVHVNERLQSLAELIERYRNSPVMHPSVPHALRPTIYCNGFVMPFPEPTMPIKAPRTKNRTRATRQ